MEVILLEDVKSVGKKGDVVKLSEGYARNFILKKKLGIEATKANLNDLKLQNANDEKIAKEKLDNAKKLAEEIEKLSVNLKIKTGENGRVFGSISAKEIAEAAKKQLNLELDKKILVLKDSIKSIGTHSVKVKLHPQVTAELTVKVSEE